MKKRPTIGCYYCVLFLLCLLSYCTDNASKKPPASQEVHQKKFASSGKPGSSYQDTLAIKDHSAVFYHPDSIQLGKIRVVIDSNEFDATMHEYFYQMRNARMVIHKNWPRLKIIEAKNIRYLLFRKQDGQPQLVDLDEKGDPYGLFLFDGYKDAIITDMMNIDSELSRYFNKR